MKSYRELIYGKRCSVMLHSFQTRARIRNRFIHRYMGLYTVQRRDDDWMETAIDRVFSASWDMRKNGIEGQSIESFYVNNANLRTPKSTESRSAPISEQDGIAADLESPAEVLDESDWMAASAGREKKSPDLVYDVEGIPVSSSSEDIGRAYDNGGPVIYSLSELRKPAWRDWNINEEGSAREIDNIPGVKEAMGCIGVFMHYSPLTCFYLDSKASANALLHLHAYCH